ncbi:hypothetical protein INT48_002368 [Thamnidium elegans]|uniref:Golgi apparatus membrane protein TVP18 n=1 Tax=Thamnidium elegans TaxID=101142 RepID=A0A8H7SU36_9FUNG|nr:hypothetical protein INT48_002368 [Thamnidium elegans]
MGFFDEIKSKNCSLYGQWLGIISIILLIALGIVGFTGHIIFSIVGWVIAFLLVLVEIPLCLKVCPTSPKLDSFIAYFENCYFRAILYLVFAVVMFLSNLVSVGPLIACGVSLLLASICYGIAAFTGQAYASSKILGGTGVDNVKLAALRAETDNANARSDEYTATLKQLETDHIQKDHELHSLQSKDADLRVEELEKNATKLEQELEAAEKRNEELKELYKSAKEEMDELERQLEVV